MPLFTPADATRFEIHGSVFDSIVRTETGGQTLCSWRLTVAADLVGVPHRPSHEEVLLVLTGRLQLTLDGTAVSAGPGDVVLVPAGSELRVDGGPAGGSAWVTTTRGLTATTADGASLAPPWAQ